MIVEVVCHYDGQKMLRFDKYTCQEDNYVVSTTDPTVANVPFDMISASAYPYYGTLCLLSLLLSLLTSTQKNKHVHYL